MRIVAENAFKLGQIRPARLNQVVICGRYNQSDVLKTRCNRRTLMSMKYAVTVQRH